MRTDTLCAPIINMHKYYFVRTFHRLLFIMEYAFSTNNLYSVVCDRGIVTIGQYSSRSPYSFAYPTEIHQLEAIE